MPSAVHAPAGERYNGIRHGGAKAIDAPEQALRNIKLTIEYDGTGYAGWQAQTNAVAVQTVVERTLSRIVGEPVRLIAAGRTDTGVHARGQVVNYRSRSRIPVDGLLRAANGRLPGDICILKAEEVPVAFHARFDAESRNYRYTILNRAVPSALEGRFAWHLPVPLPVDVWDELGDELVGVRDFSSFRKAGSRRVSPVCAVYDCSCWRDGERVYVSITAKSFVRGMVRAIVGTFRWLAPGVGTELETARQRLRDVLAAKDRCAGGNAAPPHGLCLVEVVYPEASVRSAAT